MSEYNSRPLWKIPVNTIDDEEFGSVKDTTRKMVSAREAAALNYELMVEQVENDEVKRFLMHMSKQELLQARKITQVENLDPAELFESSEEDYTESAEPVMPPSMLMGRRANIFDAIDYASESKQMFCDHYHRESLKHARAGHKAAKAFFRRMTILEHGHLKELNKLRLRLSVAARQIKSFAI